MYNKLLDDQLKEHFGEAGQVSDSLLPFFKVISDSYDHYEKDRKMVENSFVLSSKEMTEQNDHVKKNREDELQKAHTQLNMLFENIEEIFYSVDVVKLKIIQISAACEKVYGYTSTEFLDDRDLWYRVILPEDVHIVDQHFKELYGGKPVISQYRILHKDKSIRWLESKIIPVLDEAGQLIRLDGVTNDITERKRAEKEQEESVSLLEATIESTADGILVVDFEGKIVRFNKKFIELTGLPQEILDTQDDEKAISFVLEQLSNPDEFIAKVKELYAHPNDVSFDILKFKDGRIFERYSKPQLIKGNAVGRVWSFRDITEHKKSEAAILKAYEDKNTLLERIDDGFFAVDINSLVTYWNKRAEILLGPKKEDVIGKNLHEVFGATASNVFYVQYQKAISENRTIHFQEFSKRTNKWFAVSAFGSENGLSVYFKDVTEHKESEDKIKESELRYRSVIEQASDAICITDSSLKFYDMNPSGCRMLGYSKEEFLKLSIADLFFAEDLEVNPFKIEDLQAGKTIRSDRRLKRRDGAIIEVDLSGKIMNDGRFIMFGRDISERKKAENQIKESELRYRSLIEQANDAICIADISMKIIDINPSGSQLLGYSKKEFLGLSVADLFLPEELKANPFKIDELKSGKAISNERRFIKKDGTIVEVELNGKLLDDGRFILFGRNISERKQAERQIKESELRYRSLIEQATDAICIADRSLQFIDMNPYACEFLGYTREEALALFVPDIIFPEDLATNPINRFNTIKSNEIIRNERRLKRKDGSSVIMEVSTRLMEDGRFIMFGHDISERKKAESGLKENEGRLSVAAQIAKLGYWEYDVASNMFKFNDQFYSIFKTTAEKVGGYTMSSERYAGLFVHPDDISIVIKAAADAIKSPDPHYTHQIEHQIKYASGETGYMASRYFTVKNTSGRTTKTFGAIQDITESKKKEAKLLRSEASLDLMNKELELKNKELEHFAFVASHDLQEPLRTTSSFINLLQQQYKGKLDEKADKYLHYITDSTDRMKILITDLLDYSRIGSKKELQQVDCKAILNELLQDLGTTIKETGAEISVGILPVISGYKTEIKQLFQNLIVNAIKFRKKDTTPRVSISARKDNACWTFAIRDNGIGMAEEHADRIFVIFQRLHTRTEYEGSGIGLAHCKKIVGLHGGDIWVESKPGEGATFYFTIP